MPPWPVIRIDMRKFEAWKPVATISTSASCTCPSAVRTPVAVIPWIGSVTRCMYSRRSVAGQVPLSRSIRLAAGGYCPLHRMHGINDIALALYELPKPVVTKVRGVAVGAGWNLALGYDFVVSTPDTRFSQIFAKRGLSLDFGGSWLLPRIVGMQQAKRLALLGEIIGVEEARELGLVTWVKEDGELDEFVADLAGRLAQGPSIAVAQSKAMLHAGSYQSFREALENRGPRPDDQLRHRRRPGRAGGVREQGGTEVHRRVAGAMTYEQIAYEVSDGIAPSP
ncbi:enoyl-CoA hydratase/isomerase family protein [Saccharopolyspora spinosa]|nr:enoyl-CoA hydratase-related protein [Saccharopolyspora spinosa]